MGEQWLDQLWDVIVVGAGPAGSSAARAAAERGGRVLLLDRATLPRYKTCGGGIIGTSLSALPAGLDFQARGEVRAVTFTLNGRLARTRRIEADAKPLFSLVDRAQFDYALVEAARRAGAGLRTGVTITSVEVGESGPEHVILRARDGSVFRARCVVGADGSSSRVGAFVGVRCEQIDLGLEAEIAVPERVARQWRDRIGLDWGRAPGSYGWVFPKGDTLSVGVIASRGYKAANTNYFRTFVHRCGLEGYPAEVSSGHLTRCRSEGSPLHRGRVLVAGDAAGLLEPWTREGISFALRSGQLAGEYAQAIAREGTEEAGNALGRGYAESVRVGMGEEMGTGGQLLHLFQSCPWLFHGAVTLLPPAWSVFIDFMRGKSSFADLAPRRSAAGATLRHVNSVTEASRRALARRPGQRREPDEVVRVHADPPR